MTHSDEATLALYRRLYGLTDGDLIETDEVSERRAILAAMADYGTPRPHAFDIVADDCAVVVVDMQVGFTSRTSPQWIPQAERIVPRTDEFAEEARARGIPVLFTSATFLDPSPTDALEMTTAIADGNLASEAGGLALAAGLWRPGDVLIGTKHTYDAFWQTDLDYRLRGLGRRTLIITGTLTNFCCEATARAGFDRGYHVVLASDLCASDNPWAHDASLQTIQRGFGRVLDAAAIVAEWTRARE